MNKLLIDNNIDNNDIFVDSDQDLEIVFNDTERVLNIHIAKGCRVRGFIRTKNTKNTIRYILDDDTSVEINKLSIDCSDTVTIELNDINSNIKYNTSIINYLDNSYTQKIVHNKSDTRSKIVNHCINVDNNEFVFKVDGIIARNSSSVKFNQDNKIINLRDGKSNILPNLIVDDCDVEASHSAYIGTFDENAKFYMMSRGLTSNECDDLLIKAFLLNDMKLDEHEREVFSSIIETINK